MKSLTYSDWFLAWEHKGPLLFLQLAESIQPTLDGRLAFAGLRACACKSRVNLLFACRISSWTVFKSSAPPLSSVANVLRKEMPSENLGDANSLHGGMNVALQHCFRPVRLLAVHIVAGKHPVTWLSVRCLPAAISQSI